METPTPSETHEAAIEHEPSPQDVAIACGVALIGLLGDPDGVDLLDMRENIAEIRQAADLEEALGIAGALFDFFGVEYDDGFARLHDMLQFEAIAPNGDGAS